MRDPDLASVDARLAARLAELRDERGWSLDELATRTGISRSTLSRLERAEISPTAALLGRLCAAYERTMSRLLAEVESGGEPAQLVRAADQRVWTDTPSGFERRSVSPPHPGLRAEIVEGVLRPGAAIAYEGPPVAGLEHHVWLREGALEVTIQGRAHRLAPGDCLRYRLWGTSRFHCPGPDAALYAVVVVLP
ncbi:XRE family transcriptional regulator [Actinacidiphila glaucinigra]|uniref:helix-turn-helix domain-containing protein n=1 Tax=Actinacidiphila glaucinigra TaxID=235986 RepID=UPI002DD8E174|nr:XRE family transcriptional regulator [Actinacidiphila glaucinigra]WSD64073.1 XRE family transcriptional regulator [Actinacidiphila glaucinigra]